MSGPEVSEWRKDVDTPNKHRLESKASVQRFPQRSDQRLRTQSGPQPTGGGNSVSRMFGSTLAEIFSAPGYNCRLEGSKMPSRGQTPQLPLERRLQFEHANSCTVNRGAEQSVKLITSSVY